MTEELLLLKQPSYNILGKITVAPVAPRDYFEIFFALENDFKEIALFFVFVLGYRKPRAPSVFFEHFLEVFDLFFAQVPRMELVIVTLFLFA